MDLRAPACERSGAVLQGPYASRSTATTGRAPGFQKASENVVVAGDDGRHEAAYDCIKAFSETDFTEDLKKFDVPTLILHGDDDQIVPIGAAALMSAKIVKNATLKVYPGFRTECRQPTRTRSMPTCSSSWKRRRVLK